MATNVQRLIGTSEEDDEEEMDMDVKEDDDDDENGEKHIQRQVMVGVYVGVAPNSSNNNQFQHQQQIQEQVGTPGGGGVRRSRPLEEKERTKLRERQRSAITARILAGLRRHGNYNLRVRADINDVIAALAREAGWVALPDGTTFPSISQGSRPAGATSAMVTSSSSHMVSQQTPSTSLRGVSSGYRSSVEYNTCRMKGSFMPTPSPYDLSPSAQSQPSALVGDGGEKTENPSLIGGPLDAVNEKQIADVPPK